MKLTKGSKRYYEVLLNRGCSSWSDGNKESATHDFQEVMTFSKPDSLRYLDVKALTFLSGICRDIKRFDLATEFHDKAGRLIADAEKKSIANPEWNDAKCDFANEKGLYFLVRGDLENANIWLKKAEELSAGRGIESISLVNLGLLYMNQNRMDIALKYFNEAATKGDVEFGKLLVAVNSMHIYISLKNFDAARKISEEYGSRIESTSHSELLNSYYINKALIEENECNFEKALTFWHLSDSIENLSDNPVELNRVAEHLTNIIEKKNSEGDSGNTNFFYMIIGILIAILTGVLIYHWNFIRKHKLDNIRLQSFLKQSNKDMRDLESLYEEINEREEDQTSPVGIKSKHIVEALFKKKLILLHPELTRNEMDMCLYLIKDLSAKEIAELSNRSVRTIESVKYSIKKKLGINEPTYNYLKRVNAMSLQDVRDAMNAQADNKII
ncbi:MAG: hypothetical protein K2K81_05795 [Muribaculaceae bacterium]|nr:hypothetical protein [Muribaculaceae bacterium]